MNSPSGSKSPTTTETTSNPSRDADAGSHPYLSLSKADRRDLLEELGLESFDPLEADIPEELRVEFTPQRSPMTEAEVLRRHREMASRNRTMDELTCFLGGGVYDHFVPSTVMQLMGREEFLTSYTPYQAEMNQGSLQGMFEYQSMISALMGLPVTNASMYDGATAFAEAVLMAVNETDRDRILYSPGLFDSWVEVLRSYASPLDWELEALPVRGGRAVFPESWEGDPPAAVCMAYPNKWGAADAVTEWSRRRPDDTAVGIAGVNGLAMGLLTPPGQLGWDVAVAEGQPLGLPLQLGAPQLGLFSARERFLRKMPGRLVGETEDRHGNRCYVLTLQTREQHIRRERATSNICTNHALLTLGVAVFLATLGPDSLRERARENHRRGQLLKQAFEQRGLRPVGEPIFNEVALQTPQYDPDLNNRLAREGWMGGYWDGDRYVVAATEQRTAGEIERFAEEVVSRLGN